MFNYNFLRVENLVLRVQCYAFFIDLLFPLLMSIRLLRLDSHKMLSIMFPCETLVFSNDRCYLAFVIHAFWYSKMWIVYHIGIVTIYLTIDIYIYIYVVGD